MPRFPSSASSCCTSNASEERETEGIRREEREAGGRHSGLYAGSRRCMLPINRSQSYTPEADVCSVL